MIQIYTFFDHNSKNYYIIIKVTLPGKNTLMYHPLTSFHRHCQIHHSSLVLKIRWPAAVLQKIRNHLQLPRKLYKANNKVKKSICILNNHCSPVAKNPFYLWMIRLLLQTVKGNCKGLQYRLDLLSPEYITNIFVRKKVMAHEGANSMKSIIYF